MRIACTNKSLTSACSSTFEAQLAVHCFFDSKLVTFLGFHSLFTFFTFRTLVVADPMPATCKNSRTSRGDLSCGIQIKNTPLNTGTATAQIHQVTVALRFFSVPFGALRSLFSIFSSGWPGKQNTITCRITCNVAELEQLTVHSVKMTCVYCKVYQFRTTKYP